MVLADFVSREALDRMRVELEARYELEGEHAGWEGGRQLGPDGEVTVRRLTNCYSKSLSVAQLGADPVLIGFAQLGLQGDARWCAANFHDPVPTTPAAAGPSGHAPGHQALHADSGGNRPRHFNCECPSYFALLGKSQRSCCCSCRGVGRYDRGERQVILPTASWVSNEGGSSPLLVLVPAVSWPWVPAWGSLEPPRRDGENAQKTRENGG